MKNKRKESTRALIPQSRHAKKTLDFLPSDEVFKDTGRGIFREKLKNVSKLAVNSKLNFRNYIEAPLCFIVL